MNIVVLGANGMIGSTMLRILARNPDWVLTGTVRAATTPVTAEVPAGRWLCGVDLAGPDALAHMFRQTRPDVVVNCAGLTKHLAGGNDPIPALTMNALLPHRLAELCGISRCRLIHISTDCVFSGTIGGYGEDDHPDATDVYGRTKHLGEVEGDGLLTLRTSTIGHEVGTRRGLLEWFLAQKHCKGYRKAIFSGLPTVEFARIVRDLVIPNPALNGLYHVGAQAIDKDRLLRLIAQVYGRTIAIETDDSVVLDRSLNSQRFAAATGYRAADWTTLIEAMHRDQIEGVKKNV